MLPLPGPPPAVTHPSVAAAGPGVTQDLPPPRPPQNTLWGLQGGPESPNPIAPSRGRVRCWPRPPHSRGANPDVTPPYLPQPPPQLLLMGGGVMSITCSPPPAANQDPPPCLHGNHSLHSNCPIPLPTWGGCLITEGGSLTKGGCYHQPPPQRKHPPLTASCHEFAASRPPPPPKQQTGGGSTDPPP